MRKTLLLLCALLTLGVSGAWADVTVTLADASQDPYNLGVRSNSGKTFTSNAMSGLEGVALTVTGSVDHYTQGTYSGRLALKTSATSTDETWTLTAPEGYLIKGYSFSAMFASSNTATITAGETEYSISSSAYTDVAVSGLKVKSTSFTVNASVADWIAVGPFTVTLAKIDFISLTFDKPGSTTTDIKVNVKDADGDAIPGVIATLESTSCTEFKTGSATALSRTTNSVLAPNAGYDNKQGSAITYTFKVVGLPTTFTYYKAALDVYALTGGGAAQNHDGTCVREWTFDVATGSAANAVTSFVNQTGNDICTVTDQDGGLYHKLWTMTGTDKTATDALYIVVTLTKTDSQGCYAGLGEVQLYKPGATVKYVISDEGGNTVFTSDVLNTTEGDVITELPTAYKRDFCSYSAINQTMVAGENTVNVTVTYNLPFEVGTDKKYLATLRGHYVYYDETNTDVRTNQSSKEYNDNYYWSFYGNPYSGIKMKNAATGTYLDNTSSTVQLSAEGYSWTIVSLNSTSTFGLYNGSNYINEQNHDNHNLIYYSNFTGDKGSQWTVEAAPNGTVQVTYNLVVNGSTVNTSTIEQPINSDVSIPSSFTSSYSTLGYDFATSGTIGTENCTITVTATLKSGVVTALSQLSNDKAYTLNTTRGSLGVNDTQMVSTNGTSYTASNFAVISYENNFYLYSVAAGKFVANTTQPALTDDISTIAPLVFDATNATTQSPIFFMGMGSNGVNVAEGYGTGIVVNSWTTRDEGNQYCIIEAADFDATDAVEALEEYFHPAAETVFNEVIAQLEALSFGAELGQYSLTGDYAGYESQATTIISGLKTQGYTENNLTIAQGMLDAKSLNMPNGKFIRLKNTSVSGYSYVGTAASGKAPLVADASNAGIYYVTDDSKIVSYDQGLNLTTSAGAECGVSAATFTIADGGNGTYTFSYGGSGYLIAWTSGYTDRLSSVSDYARFTVEEVADQLPVTISGAKYATLYAPVALTIPSGVKAYVISSLTTTEATLSEVSTTIPANTPVILSGDAGTYNFAITTSDAFSGTNKLAGQVAAFTVSEDDVTKKVYYTLQQNVAGDAVGLFPKTAAGSIAGFKAYLPASNFPAGVKGFTFIFEDGTETGINAIQNVMNSDAIFNLAGQRVEKAQRGIYIVNGKKVVIK